MPVAVGASALGVLAYALLWAVAALAVSMLAAFTFWTLSATRTSVGRVPLIGGAIVPLVDALTLACQVLFGSMNYIMSPGLAWVGYYMGWFIQAVTGGAWALLMVAFTQVNHYIQFLLDTTALTNRVISGALVPAIQQAQTAAALGVRLGQQDLNFTQQWTIPNINNIYQVIGSELQRDARQDQQIVAIQAQLSTAIIPAILALQAFLPLLRSLAEYERSTSAGVAAAQAGVAVLQQQGRVQGAQIESLLPLAGIAALSAGAIATLEKLAEDPCYCLTQGDMSDLPQRVTALEMYAS